MYWNASPGSVMLRTVQTAKSLQEEEKDQREP